MYPLPPILSTMTQDPQTTTLRVLVAEDVEEVRLTARRLLEAQGHEVTEARTGSEALSILNRRDFDVILMDVVMPDIDGIEVTRRFRDSEPDGSHTPVLAFTAGGPSAKPELCLEAGMDAFLRKPVNPPVLVETVARFGGGKSEVPSAGNELPTSLREVAKGDRKLLEEMARVFLEFAPLQLRELRLALADEDDPRVVEVAHQLRGSARVFRADGILIPAERLEFLASRGVLAEANTLVEVVAREVEALERTLKRVLDRR